MAGTVHQVHGLRLWDVSLVFSAAIGCVISVLFVARLSSVLPPKYFIVLARQKQFEWYCFVKHNSDGRLKIYVWHIFGSMPTRVQGWTGGLGEGCSPPPPILGSANTKKHVLEVNWMVISGYLPLSRARNG